MYSFAHVRCSPVLTLLGLNHFYQAVMGVRLPTILGKAIQDAVVTLNTLSSTVQIEDLAACITRMEQLMLDLFQNNALRPITDDGEGDIPLWNKEIAKFFRGKDWMSAPWLFAEAYKYRRLRECFSVSEYWKEYDVFFRQKVLWFSPCSRPSRCSSSL
jgi:hypothetical protein